MNEFEYVGSELDLFAAAENWKAYWSSHIGRYLSGDVLEVGAGIGSNTALLSSRTKGRWTCLEPDATLIRQLRENLAERDEVRSFEGVCGTLETLDPKSTFDTIMYIDVLEHIEDDHAELERAAGRLRAGGRLIVLSPAHQWLYSPFDKAIGHFRRYNRKSVRRVSPAGLRLESLFYLDACGILASGANHFFLQQAMPTATQIGVWDKWIIPASRVVDPLFGYLLGKSIVGVWQRPS